ncbi:protein Z, vitamin K-dependent plasma glycoprotein b [Micropterus dolomieu]|uniref:protein Z, vitamin K-dependent plasma glycoprotein b n=1 Tax=Micropterus dolomieu TaxID=147949 RepID=UPI001E8DF2F7|nr:protein Z, vitamin K-dependent plasma glycoprotein b [Micropterus dolomieu]
MAVSIMAACCRASVLSLSLLACFLQVVIHGQVFQAPQTHDVFLRSKRANMFLLEEILQGNLERECYEELCNYEEAREYFEDNDKTYAFWTVYQDGDQCQPNPCLHGGNCTDKVGGFHCSCTAPHHGPLCELGAPHKPEGHVTSAPQIIREISECPTDGPKACHQMCTVSHHTITFTCSCVSGFKLQTDGRSCLPEVEFPCGRLPGKFNTTASVCHHGNCPWQVSLVNSSRVELCGGVVLGRRSVLTAARCLFLDPGSGFYPSNYFVVSGDKKTLIPVRALYVHDRFHTDHHDNDLALLELAGPLPFSSTLIHLCLPPKDFSENILMHPGRTGVAVRRGVGATKTLVYMTLEECRRQLNVSHPLSNKMFCMRNPTGAQGRSAGPIGNPTGAQGRSAGPIGNPTGAQGRSAGPTGNPTGAQGRSAGPTGNPTGAQGRSAGPTGNPTGAQGRSAGPTGNPTGAHGRSIRPSGNQNGAMGRLNKQTVNQNRTQNGKNGADSYNSRSHKPSEGNRNARSKVSGGQCGGQLQGTPVATVQKGTAFLTGLLLSSSAGCDGGGGLVFTKLSRYMSWIRPRLQAAEDHMTPQVSVYPENP